MLLPGRPISSGNWPLMTGPCNPPGKSTPNMPQHLVRKPANPNLENEQIILSLTVNRHIWVDDVPEFPFGGRYVLQVVPWRHMSHISLPGPFTHSYRSKNELEDVWYGRLCRFITIPGGAGFLPSTVVYVVVASWSGFAKKNPLFFSCWWLKNTSTLDGWSETKPVFFFNLEEVDTNGF